MARAIPVVVLLTTAIALPATAAHAAPLAAGHWDHTQLTYAVAPALANQEPEIRRALKAISAVSALRFSRVPQLERADIVLSAWNPRPLDALPSGVGGQTDVVTVGTTEDARERTIHKAAVNLFALRSRQTVRRFRPLVERTIVHELLHAVGLLHRSRTGACSTMAAVSTEVAPTSCAEPPRGRWRCRLVEPADRDALRTLYGGPRRSVARRIHCPTPARFLAPTGSRTRPPARLEPYPLPLPPIAR
ncbi:matrixin family metalloprotease [Patulibacter defluvii]|uniref:matrixin family metalloprotease n=1 Tax=Patulibacter defluvii TaxID=3095358 RepID=UPI002A759C9A|nr:matrixin family metalloprotease [Patulibacter sp. DM4]